jgi:hypothetical protein
MTGIGVGRSVQGEEQVGRRWFCAGSGTLRRRRLMENGGGTSGAKQSATLGVFAARAERRERGRGEEG